MSKAQDDAWFYTRKGGRHGPVTLGEMKKLAESGDLDPRYDLCWKQGMADWCAAGEIEGVFTKIPASSGGRPPGVSAALAGDGPSGAAHMSMQDAERMLREADWPGVSRVGYWFCIWVLPLFIAAGLVILLPEVPGLLEPEAMKWVNLAVLGGTLLYVAFLVAVSLRRFTNLGMSRWWFLGNFVPVLSLWVAYRSLCCPPGYAYHGKLDGAGVFLAIVYWGVVVMACAAFALTFATTAGHLSGGVFDQYKTFLESHAGGVGFDFPAPNE